MEDYFPNEAYDNVDLDQGLFGELELDEEVRESMIKRMKMRAIAFKKFCENNNVPYEAVVERVMSEEINEEQYRELIKPIIEARTIANMELEELNKKSAFGGDDDSEKA